MTRVHWRTRLRRRPRRGAESVRSSHAVDSVGVVRRVSASFLSHLSGKRRSETCASPRGAPAPAIRRCPPAHRRACQVKGGLPAMVLPPPQLCTPMFARLARSSPRSATQNRASGRFEGPKVWRFAREACLDNRYTPTGLSKRRRSIKAPFKLHFIGCRTTLPTGRVSYVQYHRGQGESPVPPHTCGSVSLSVCLSVSVSLSLCHLSLSLSLSLSISVSLYICTSAATVVRTEMRFSRCCSHVGPWSGDGIQSSQG